MEGYCLQPAQIMYIRNKSEMKTCANMRHPCKNLKILYEKLNITLLTFSVISVTSVT